MHVIESELSSRTDLRVAAMHDRSPIHTFLFDSDGMLLTANQTALLACERDTSGAPMALVTYTFALLISHDRGTCWLCLGTLYRHAYQALIYCHSCF